MFILRSVIYFILLFFLLEMVALSAVCFSFYESLRNALKQESILADHRARDFSLAIAKASELRLNPIGFTELNTTYSRYVEETSKDPEKFLLKEIRLYSPLGILLSSSIPAEVKETLDKRKPDIELTKETYFRKAMRMRKWEWPDNDKENTLNLKTTLPEVPKFASILLKIFPLARANEARIYVPLYHETKLDVTGAVFVTYARGNLLLLFDNQFDLFKWVTFNYCIIAFVLSIILWGIFFLFQYFAKREGEKGGQTIETEKLPEKGMPLIEKKIMTSSETAEPLATSQLSSAIEAPITSSQVNQEIKKISVPSEVMDAIYLG